MIFVPFLCIRLSLRLTLLQIEIIFTGFSVVYLFLAISRCHLCIIEIFFIYIYWVCCLCLYYVYPFKSLNFYLDKSPFSVFSLLAEKVTPECICISLDILGRSFNFKSLVCLELIFAYDIRFLFSSRLLLWQSIYSKVGLLNWTIFAKFVLFFNSRKSTLHPYLSFRDCLGMWCKNIYGYQNLKTIPLFREEKEFG